MAQVQAGQQHCNRESYENKIMPFCLAGCVPVPVAAIDDNSDEEASIARMAMLEAFDNDEPQRADLLSLPGGTLFRQPHHRLQAQRREGNVCPFSAFQSEPYQALEGAGGSRGQRFLRTWASQQDLEALQIGTAAV